MRSQHVFATISDDALSTVNGGAVRKNDEQLTLMLTQLSSSIKSVAENKNKQDPSMMMMIFAMMGMGKGGGGQQVAAAPPPEAPAAPASPTMVNVNVRGRRGFFG